MKFVAGEFVDLLSTNTFSEESAKPIQRTAADPLDRIVPEFVFVSICMTSKILKLNLFFFSFLSTTG